MNMKVNVKEIYKNNSSTQRTPKFNNESSNSKEKSKKKDKSN